MKIGKEGRVLLDDTLGKFFVEIRKQKDLSQVEFAEILSLSKTMIGYIENGERLPTMKTLFDLSDKLSVEIKELVSRRATTLQNTYAIHGDKTPHHVLNEYYLMAYYMLFE